MTLEISKCLEPKGRMEPRVREIPPQIQKTGLIFHPSPWGRLIESCLSSLSSFFFFTFFSCRGSRGVEKGKKMLSRGKRLQGVRMPKTVGIYHPPGMWMKCWGLQTGTLNSSTADTVWNTGTTAECPSSHMCHHPASPCQIVGPTEEPGCTVLLDPRGRRT